MDIRPLSETFAVSPQISPSDLTALKAAGYGTVICNRPDDEIPPNLRAEEMKAAAEALGLAFVLNPIQPGEITPHVTSVQRATVEDSAAPVLAYCASGTRSTIAWLVAHAPDHSADELLAAARGAGYALDMLRPQLDALYRA